MSRLITSLTLLLLALCSSSLTAAQEIVRIDKPSAEVIKELQNSQYDVAAVKPGAYIDLVVTPEEKSELARRFTLTVKTTEANLQRNLQQSRALSGYRSYDQMLAELKDLVAKYPNILKLYSIGESQGKKYAASGLTAYNNYQQEIWALKVSDNVETEEDEPSYYFMGNHHAREVSTMEMNMKILHELVDNYPNNAAMAERINNSQIWFLPLVNPNGHKVVMDGLYTMQRKNIRDNNNNKRVDGGTTDGVDLNRNYDYSWTTVGASDNPSDETYRGPSALSEPELLSIKGLFNKIHFAAGISYHSYSEQVLYPYSYAYNAKAPDHNALKALSDEMAKSIPASDGTTYQSLACWELYPCGGSLDDFSYARYGTFCYTIEMGTDFIPTATQMNKDLISNLKAPFILLDRAKKSTLTGLVKDAQTGKAVVAEISIGGIDDTQKTRVPYVSDSMYGRYLRFLVPGNYTLKVSAPGYKTQTFSSVAITNTGVTKMDLSLEPTTGTSTSWNTLLKQDFESSFPPAGWSNSNPGWAQASNGTSGSKCAGVLYTPAGTRILTTPAIEVGKYDSLRVRFSWKNDDVLRVKGHDTTWCDYSQDSGASWKNLALLSAAGQETSYKELSILLPSGITQPLKFRWRQKTDGTDAAYGVGLDDIFVEKYEKLSIASTTAKPEAITLVEAYPNPFNPQTTISFNLAQEGLTTLKIYNGKGELVQTICQDNLSSGKHSLTFDGSRVQSGVYFYHLTQGEASQSGKLLLVK